MILTTRQISVCLANYLIFQRVTLSRKYYCLNLIGLHTPHQVSKHDYDNHHAVKPTRLAAIGKVKPPKQGTSKT
jgi:hypothetical protein